MDKTGRRNQEFYSDSVQVHKGDGIVFKILSTLLIMYVISNKSTTSQMLFRFC